MDTIGDFLKGVANTAELVVLGLVYVAMALFGFAALIYIALWTIQEIDRNRQH